MFRFSIRELSLLTVIVALILGWYFDRRPIIGRFQLELNEANAMVLDKSTGQVWSWNAQHPNSTKGFYEPKITK